MKVLMSVIHREWFNTDDLTPKDPPSAPQRNGLLAVIDWSTKAVTPLMDWDSPAGFCVTDQGLFVASMFRHDVVHLGPGLRRGRSLRHPWFSDLHTVTASRGGLLVVSSGLDSVIEVDPRLARTNWTWSAYDHGYDRLSDGRIRAFDRRLDYSLSPTPPTVLQTTHINSAREDAKGNVVCTLFQQGQVVLVDRRTGSTRTLLRGLSHPHSVRRTPGGGWSVCDTAVGSFVTVDEDWRVGSLMEGNFEWLQDGIVLDAHRALILDADHQRVVACRLADGLELDECRYPDRWKAFQIEVVTDARLDALKGN